MDGVAGRGRGRRALGPPAPPPMVLQWDGSIFRLLPSYATHSFRSASVLSLVTGLGDECPSQATCGGPSLPPAVQTQGALPLTPAHLQLRREQLDTRNSGFLGSAWISCDSPPGL